MLFQKCWNHFIPLPYMVMWLQKGSKLWNIENSFSFKPENLEFLYLVCSIIFRVSTKCVLSSMYLFFTFYIKTLTCSPRQPVIFLASTHCLWSSSTVNLKTNKVVFFHTPKSCGTLFHNFIVKRLSFHNLHLYCICIYSHKNMYWCQLPVGKRARGVMVNLSVMSKSQGQVVR